MRVLLFTGKGGVGKTSIAAATALAAAGEGARTLVMSTDPAHSLADSFDVVIGSEATEITPRLWGMQIDSQGRLEESWREIQDYAVDVLAWTGMSGIQAEELSVIPGLDELFSLADIKRYAQSGEYDVLVVDCAPTAETLRLLSLPEILSWYIEKIFPVERKIVNAVRPVLSRMKSLPPIASDSFFAAVERFYDRISGIREVLVDPRVSSIRLVMNAEKMVIDEARRTFTYLSMFGYRVDAVVVNRLIPDEVEEPYFKAWKQLQVEHLNSIEQSFSPLPVLKARLFDREMVGIELLKELAAEVYKDRDPSEVMFTEEVMKLSSNESGHLLSLKLPLVDRNDIDVARSGDQLLIKIGGFKRNVILPRAVMGQEISEARFDGEWLNIGFHVRTEPGALNGTE